MWDVSIHLNPYRVDLVSFVEDKAWISYIVNGSVYGVYPFFQHYLAYCSSKNCYFTELPDLCITWKASFSTSVSNML